MPARLLRFLCALVLALAALPVRSGTVCVVDGRVVARCARPCCPPTPKRRCVPAFRKGNPVVAPLGHDFAFPALLPPQLTVTWASFPEPLGSEIPTPRKRPLFERPRAPDRGRAPPF